MWLCCTMYRSYYELAQDVQISPAIWCSVDRPDAVFRSAVALICIAALAVAKALNTVCCQTMRLLTICRSVDVCCATRPHPLHFATRQ